MLATLDHRRPELRLQGVQLGLGGGQVLSSTRPQLPVLAEDLAGPRVLQPIDVLQRGDLHGQQSLVVVLQTVIPKPLAKDQLLLQMQCGPLETLFVQGRQLWQTLRIAAARQGGDPWNGGKIFGNYYRSSQKQLKKKC